MPGDETWHKPEQAQRGQCTEGGKILGWSGWATHTPELAWEPGVGHGGAGHGDSWEMSVPGLKEYMSGLPEWPVQLTAVGLRSHCLI